jgi:hypothetical protein
LNFPINREDVQAIGMGGTQIANGKTFNAMMYNPSFLGKKKSVFEIIGIQASLPTSSFDAAFFLQDNFDEFNEAISLTEVWNGVNAFFETGATIEQKLEALEQIQNGMRFSRDLFNEVIGSSTDPKRHGVSILPGISMQIGNLGVSIYGFGQSGFIVQQSSTMDALLEIEIPENLDNPVQAAKSVAQLLGILGTVIIQGTESFSSEVFPVSYYLSYIDMVGTIGYGYEILKDLNIGANLKLVNRRFITDRIPLNDYDKIFDEAWENLKTDITGITLDIGGLYHLKFGTDIGISLQNIIPIQTITKTIDNNFIKFINIHPDKLPNGQIITNEQGDTALVNVSSKIHTTRPYTLKMPFIANIGICHPITSYWDVSFDWVDIAKQDSRFKYYTDRFRFGTEYRIETLNKNLIISPRLGLADGRISVGLGINIFNIVQLDGAYAYDKFVKDYSYFTQLRIGW